MDIGSPASVLYSACVAVGKVPHCPLFTPVQERAFSVPIVISVRLRALAFEPVAPARRDERRTVAYERANGRSV